MQNFNIDISQPRGPLVLYASQGDSLSRFFSVTVTDNGAAYTPPEGAVYTVRFGAPGMPAGWYDTITEVGGSTHPAVVVDGNTITVELAEQAVSVPGTNAVVLIVSAADGYTLASWAFVLQVSAVPGYDAPEATVYYNALTEQVAQVLSGATAAAASATLAESWAVGGTGTREGENTNNARYWAEQAQQVSQEALGWYETEQALKTAHPTGENGQWAIIGSTDTIWTWDSDTNAWVDSGAGDMARAIYDPTGQKRDVFAAIGEAVAGAGHMEKSVYAASGEPGAVDRALRADSALAADDGVKVYTHSKSGTVHEFTGTGANGRAKMTADVQAGDTFQINGTPVTAYMGTDSAVDAMAGSPWNGKWVSFIVEGGTLNFSAAAKATEIALSGVFQDSLASPATGYSQVSIPVAGTWPELVESESISTKVEPADKYNYRRVSFEVKRAGRYVVSISAGTLSSTYTTIVDAKLVDSDGKTVAKADPSGYLYTHGWAVCDLQEGVYQLQVNRTSGASVFCAITIVV